MQILFAALRQVIALLQQNPALASKLTDPWTRSPPLIRRIAFACPRPSVVLSRVGDRGRRLVSSAVACQQPVAAAALSCKQAWVAAWHGERGRQINARRTSKWI